MSPRKPKATRSGVVHLWNGRRGLYQRCGGPNGRGSMTTSVEARVTCRRCLNFMASGTRAADPNVTAKNPWQTALLAQRERRAAKK